MSDAACTDTLQVNPRSGRYDYIDLLETMCIYLVVLFHGMSHGAEADAPVWTTAFSFWFGSLITANLPLFFMINGWLLFQKPLNLKKHIRKCLRLIILTVAWDIIDTFLAMLIRHVSFSPVEFVMAVWKLKTGYSEHLWYMCALICIYIFFPLLKAAYDHERIWFYAFTAVCGIMTYGNTALNLLASLVLHFLTGSRTVFHSNWFNLFNAFQIRNGWALFPFCLGGAALDLLPRVLPRMRGWLKGMVFPAAAGLLAATLYWACGLVFSEMLGEQYNISWEGLSSPTALVTAVSVWVLSIPFHAGPRLSALLQLVSRNTLGIYLLHVVYDCLLLRYLRGAGLLPLGLAGGAVYALTVLVLSLATVLILRRIPVLRRLVA